MATFANISDILTTTIESRSGALADNLTKNNALLMKMKQRGNVKLPKTPKPLLMWQIIFNFIRNEQRPNGPKQKRTESIVSLLQLIFLY